MHCRAVLGKLYILFDCDCMPYKFIGLSKLQFYLYSIRFHLPSNSRRCTGIVRQHKCGILSHSFHFYCCFTFAFKFEASLLSHRPSTSAWQCSGFYLYTYIYFCMCIKFCSCVTKTYIFQSRKPEHVCPLWPQYWLIQQMTYIHATVCVWLVKFWIFISCGFVASF